MLNIDLDGQISWRYATDKLSCFDLIDHLIIERIDGNVRELGHESIEGGTLSCLAHDVLPGTINVLLLNHWGRSVVLRLLLLFGLSFFDEIHFPVDVHNYFLYPISVVRTQLYISRIVIRLCEADYLIVET